VSHPEPNGPPDRTPIQVGEIWENPVTRERATIVELPWRNPARRAVAELTALVGARVVGEHRHPALVERFTVLEGQLTVKRDGHTTALHQGETAVIEPGVWHDWWNAGEHDARVRVEVPLQLALSAREFSDVFVFRSPPPAVQRAIFGALAPIARWRGYRATYPQLSRMVLAPRT
jgi:quercetin dioxygenase-like cupin family protein